MTISTFSLELGDSPLPQERPDSKRSRSASQTSDAGLSSNQPGACPSNPTSENSTARSTVTFTEESLFSPEDLLASLPAVPGSREAKEMTAGSGRKLCACLTRVSRIASFSRILLESSTWGSTEYFLRWEGRATKCNASIFRLVPWTPRNSGIESGLSGSRWPAPMASDMKQNRNRTAKRNKIPPTGIHDGQTLTDAMSTWPTPQSRDEKGETQNAHRMDAVPNVLKASWPTLKASDGEKQSGGHRGTLDTTPAQLRATGKTQYGCLARTENFVVRLTTLSTWLMGYTGAYLARWETRSVRKSRSKFSKLSVESSNGKSVSRRNEKQPVDQVFQNPPSSPASPAPLVPVEETTQPNLRPKP
jgi:hypothetical protein